MEETLLKVFGFREFRQHQRELVEGIHGGRDVFGVMPTGGGKSLCYQMPALLVPGCAVVVSPLIALMKDQVDAAKANGIRAACVNSSVPEGERRDAAEAYRNGELDLLYLAPERLAVEGVLERLRECPSGAPAFFAIDEAHCISEWGHDFRPDYLGLRRLRETFPDITIAAFTATATEKVAKDIEERLCLKQPLKVRASFDRANLFYEVRSKKDWQTQLISFLKERPGESGIVYRTTRKDVESTAALLVQNGIQAHGYHAGMDPSARVRTQDAFIRDDAAIIVATIAFGMGIDKADVRFVVHGDMPKNVESYYQETGRAGRDGEPSHCLLLYGPGDVVKQKRFIDEVTDDTERQRTLALLKEMERFASVPSCRRRSLLGYFGEEYAKENCGGCDFCSGEFRMVDATRDAQMVLSAMVRTGERFGAVHVCDVVSGASTAKIKQFGHDSLKTYGVGKDRPKTYWRGILNALIASGDVKVADDGYAVPKLTPSAWEILKSQRTFARQEDTRVEPEKGGRTSHSDDPAFDAGLFEHLRVTRKSLADAESLPPYVIFADRTLRQMAAYMPNDVSEMLPLHGIGKHKLETYGKPFVEAIAAYLEANPDTIKSRVGPLTKPISKDGPAIKRGLPATMDETYQLLQKGHSLEEIAAQRDLKLTTIESHLCRLIEEGKEVDWRATIPQEMETLLRELFEKHGPGALRPIMEAAEEKVSYGQLQIMRAVLTQEVSQAASEGMGDL